MFGNVMGRRRLMTLGAVALLAGCKAIPSSAPTQAPPPPEPTAPEPGSDLPTDTERHRVALLVPLSGSNAEVGQSIANAATMAILDTNAQNLRVTNYDTAGGAANAARRAVADGNKLILGPLLSDNIPAVVAAARPAGVPLISFSNDQSAAQNDVFVVGNLPGQSVERVVDFATSRGIQSFAALIPQGEYGERAAAALASAVRANRGSITAVERYDRGNTSIVSAAQRLAGSGGYQGVLIADGARMALRAAPEVKPAGSDVQIMGTELWSGEREIMNAPALRGAWFASVSDKNFSQFSTSYRSRFGNAPYRIATLGYDAVLLTLRVARDWRPGTTFPTRQLSDDGGFLGLDGAFRFGGDGVIERALEVRQVGSGTVTTVSPAPTRFDD